jgi:putative transposase
MARPLRVQFPGALYHVISRGIDRQIIYFDDHDRRHFLEELWRTAERKHWLVLAYCLMNNHYHLLVLTLEPTLAEGMRDVNGRFALGLNRRWHRVGYLFQSRYKAFLVQRERYLLALARYIVLNPVRARLCGHPREWRWSSYRDVIGRRSGASPRLDTRTTLDLFAPDLATARHGYEQFVLAGIGEPAPKPHPLHPLVIGDDDFVARVLALTEEAPSIEIPRAQRALPGLLDIAMRATSRDDAIRRAHATGQFKLSEIARYFGLHYATVSRIGNSGAMETPVDDVAMQDLAP